MISQFHHRKKILRLKLCFPFSFYIFFSSVSWMQDLYCLFRIFALLVQMHANQFFFPHLFCLLSILIPRLPVSHTSFTMLMWQDLNNQVCRGKKRRLVIYTSLSQVEMNKDNIIWQGNGWAVSILYGWVKKWAGTAICAGCLWASQRRG